MGQCSCCERKKRDEEIPILNKQKERDRELERQREQQQREKERTVEQLRTNALLRILNRVSDERDSVAVELHLLKMRKKRRRSPGKGLPFKNKDILISNSMPLQDFLDLLRERYPTIREKTSFSSLSITPPSSQTQIHRQFSRDIPSYVMINGKYSKGDSDKEKIKSAYFSLRERIDYVSSLSPSSLDSPSLQYLSQDPEVIFELATQTLGVHLWQELYLKYSEDGYVVRQTHCHFCDLEFIKRNTSLLISEDDSENNNNNEKQVSFDSLFVYAMAIFELIPEGQIDEHGIPSLGELTFDPSGSIQSIPPVPKIMSVLEICFDTQTVNITHSKPTNQLLSLL